MATRHRSARPFPRSRGHERNREVRAGLETVFRRNPPLIYAAGHDHSLQVLAGSSARWLVVSGAGYFGHQTRTAWLDSTRYAAAKSGYVRLDAPRGRAGPAGGHHGGSRVRGAGSIFRVDSLRGA